jgi:hypothetical protein
MNVEAKVIVGQTDDQLPEDAADVLLYFKTNGDSYLRWLGEWKRMYNRTSAVTGNAIPTRYRVPAETWRPIQFKGVRNLRPNFSIQCYGIEDPNYRIDSYKVRAITISGFEFFSPEECIMELTVLDIIQESQL